MKIGTVGFPTEFLLFPLDSILVSKNCGEALIHTAIMPGPRHEQHSARTRVLTRQTKHHKPGAHQHIA